MLGMAPAKAVKRGNVELKVKSYPKEEVAQEGGLYRYLYKPGELEDDYRRRATDMIWSWDTFSIDRIVDREGQRVLYYLADGPQRAARLGEEVVESCGKAYKSDLKRL